MKKRMRCHVVFVVLSTDDKLWVECEECTLWFHTSCVEINAKDIPDVFLCPECVI